MTALPKDWALPAAMRSEGRIAGRDLKFLREKASGLVYNQNVSKLMSAEAGGRMIRRLRVWDFDDVWEAIP